MFAKRGETDHIVEHACHLPTAVPKVVARFPDGGLSLALVLKSSIPQSKQASK